MSKVLKPLPAGWVWCNVLVSHVRELGGQDYMLEPMFSGDVALPYDKVTKMTIKRGWLKIIDNKMKNPSISVDRKAKQIAVFDQFTCVRDFQPYTDEAAAVEEAKKWVKERTDIEPTLIYPRITNIRMSS